MTISSETRKAGPFIGTGTLAVFPFTFKVFAADDLVVTELDTTSTVETTLALNSDYTASLNADQNSSPGGTITLTAGNLATGKNLVITSDVAYLQPTDLTNQGGFFPQVITTALDRLTVLVQQVKGIVSRGIRQPVTDATAMADLPSAAERANKVLTFDADGNPIAIVPSSGSIAEFAVELANDTDPTKGAAMVGLGLDIDYSDGTIGANNSAHTTMEYFGAVGDGVTSCTAAFNLLSASPVKTVLLKTGAVYYIPDENALEDFEGFTFIGDGTFKFGKVLGENTYTAPTGCPKFTFCKFNGVIFSAPDALGYAVFSTGSDNCTFENCVISDVKPHFVQGAETVFRFVNCRFVAPNTTPGTCLQTIGNVIRGLWVDRCEWNFAPNQGAGVLVSATNDARLQGDYFITNNKVFTENVTGHCIDTFVDIEPALVSSSLSTVLVEGNTIYNAKIWAGSSNVTNIVNNTIRMTSVSSGASSGYPITIGNAYSTAGSDVINIKNNTVICEDVAIDANKCPIGFASDCGRINTLNIEGNTLQANGKLINTDPASIIAIRGIDIGTVNIKKNRLSYSSVPAVLFPVINIITQDGEGTTKAIHINDNEVFGPPSSYNYFVREQNGGGATIIDCFDVSGNDLLACAPSVGLVLNSTNTIISRVIGDNIGVSYPTATSVTFTNSWTNKNLLYYQAAGYILKKNEVQLTGNITGGTLGTSAFTLPPGYRPANEIMFNVYSENSGGTPVLGRVIIKPDGTVVPQNGDANAISLGCISFPINS